ncbi:hypothetical protein ACI2KT_00970 [Ensifer adhaerens]|uniref:hypothetical protein n=1 Tax=Ensifer adhaerens TaxID=106592 RepID=UPI003850463E
MPVLTKGDDRFERGGWESFKRKLIADTELTIEEAKRRKAIAEMLLAEFAVDRQIDQRAPEAAWHHQLGWLHPAKNTESAPDEDQISPGAWTTLPEGFDPADWGFDGSDPTADTVTVRGDTAIPCEGYVRIDIAVSGKPHSLILIRKEVSENFLRDVQACFMSY